MYIMRSFIVYICHQILLVRSPQGGWKRRECLQHGNAEIYTQGWIEKYAEKVVQAEDLGVDAMIILNRAYSANWN